MKDKIKKVLGYKTFALNRPDLRRDEQRTIAVTLTDETKEYLAQQILALCDKEKREIFTELENTYQCYGEDGWSTFKSKYLKEENEDGS